MRPPQADPKAVEAQAALGLAMLAQDPGDKKGEAVAAAHQAAFLEPKSPFAALALGRVLESRGQLEPAATAYGEASERSTRRGRRRASPPWASGCDRATPTARSPPCARSPRSSGRRAKRSCSWAGSSRRRRSGPAPLAALERAAALLPGLAEAQALRGGAAYNAGELKLAADAYGRAVERDPANLAYR